MKLYINNKTNLTLKVIGEVLDQYISKSNQGPITIYNGLVHKESFFIDKRDFLLKITYRMTRLTVEVEELHIRAKEVDMKGIRFPRLPKKR